MAEDLDDGEFWLPSEFLAEDILMDKKQMGKENETGFCFPCEFPYEFGSDLSSPVESLVGSTETESDEDEFLAGLSRQMAHCMVQDDERRRPDCEGEKTKKTMARSPQSTLCAVGSWLSHSQGSSRNSPSGPSLVSSPPSTPLNPREDPWDLLCAAAGQVVRMKINDEVHKSDGRGLLGPPRKPASTGFFLNQALVHHERQNNQLQQLKQQQVLKQKYSVACGAQFKSNPGMQQPMMQRPRSGNGGFNSSRCGRPLGLAPSAWPPLPQQQQQQQPSSGMRAVFLGGAGGRRESSGTGVFLPRRVGNSGDFRKKPACSTVLLPARVVQALNLNLDEMGTALPRFHPSYQQEDTPLCRSNPLASQLQKSHHHSVRPILPPSQEIRLPPEWTY